MGLSSLPKTMPKSDTSSPNPDDKQLPSLLQQMLVDIKDPECFYWLYTNYFDIQSPTDREITRWYQAPLFLNYDSIWNAEFVDDGLLCDVILKNKLPEDRERIKVQYDQIYSIRRVLNDKPITEKDSQLYYDSSKLRMPPVK